MSPSPVAAAGMMPLLLPVLLQQPVLLPLQ
jgi:hypothetical protein